MKKQKAIVDNKANMDRCVADDEDDHVGCDEADDAVPFLRLLHLYQNTDDATGTEDNDGQWSDVAQ
ncbi:hypothetical protein EYF80_011641 [Liparis tanakae]|uniref:Uncharacterized protein n=1 Tax=Liparis tanakae TaxID=230148 RepID=A0A4Z2IJU1_9TELE|nr:hypothetical protein EYF80_011641 [Liparis tanakae]